MIIRRPERITWWVSPKSMVSLLGAEYQLIRQSGSSVLKRFYLSGVLIVLILIISACSIFYAIDLLVHNYYVEIFLAAFISLLFGLMYIFLMNTFAKDAHSPRNILTSVSNVTRIGFVLFMAFILSKPVELWLMDDHMEKKVAAYRVQLINNYTRQVNKLYQTELSQLQQLQSTQLEHHRRYTTAILDKDMKKTRATMDEVNRKRQVAIDLATQGIAHSSFFAYRVRQSARTATGWICCAIIMVLFFVPGYLIYSISGDDEYYKLKKQYETRIVKKEYAFFENQYAKIFREKFGVETQFYSAFEDPPFNTIRKKKPAYKTNDDFLEKFLKR